MSRQMIDEEEFHDWWSNASPWVQLPHKGEVRLRAAFFQALSKMPESDRDKFLGDGPLVICSDHRGMAVTMWRPVHPDRGIIPIGLIVLRHDIVNRPGLINTVAHEAAHVVLDHSKTPCGAMDLRYEQEKAADDLSASWGFQRCYSKYRLGKLKAKAVAVRRAHETIESDQSAASIR